MQLLKQKKDRLGRKGFTLVELIIVIVILAVLAGIAIPAVASYVDSANQGKVLANGRSAFMAASIVGADLLAANGGNAYGTAPTFSAQDATIKAKASVTGTITGTYEKDCSISAFTYAEAPYTVSYVPGSGNFTVAKSS